MGTAQAQTPRRHRAGNASALAANAKENTRVKTRTVAEWRTSFIMLTIKKMTLIRNILMVLLVASHTIYDTLGMQLTPENVSRYNASYIKEHVNPSGLASLFSPRMDFEQWKPLTGRGDPLRNDPTYDYEPPVLERVHYWADDTRLEREHSPEKKSEVLMLGVSSRKPSVTSRQPPLPPRRQQYRPQPPKYEDFTYKLSDAYPMTILVPPPLPPPGHKPSLYILNQEKMSFPNIHIKTTDTPLLADKDNTTPFEKVTSSFALQEANLIYQSSSTVQNWIRNVNESLPPNINNIVSSDYAGWGPTTPLNEYDSANDTHNLISNDHLEISQHPYSFYRPMLSEAPPPPVDNSVPLHLSTFLPTVLPPSVEAEQVTESISQLTWPTAQTTYETSTETQDYYEETQTTDKSTTIVFLPTQSLNEGIQRPKPEVNIFDMLGPMMSMPVVNDRPEDNLYAHATENMQIFKETNPVDILQLENMQTMQPPPIVKFAENTTASQKQLYNANSNTVDSSSYNKPLHTHDPYLHMRYTTPVSTTTSDKNKSPTEATIPMYLIIQGHSKVKNYGSKPKPSDDKHTLSNEIPKLNETNEVKHLHPIKEKFAKKLNITEGSRKSKAQNLQELIGHGHGSIEIQEADVGIKYDVSDGSDVPIELYRKGIVDSDENNYISSKETQQHKRIKRQIELEDLLPFNEDSIEEYVYNYLEGKKNETSLTGLLAQAVTSDAAAAVDELEDDADDTDDDASDQELGDEDR